MRVLAAGTVGAAVVVGTIAGCASCSATGEGGDAGADAPSDRGRDRALSDVASDAPYDGPLSDWEGWRRLPELGPECAIDVPLDPEAKPSAFAWRACSDGRSNCQEIDTDGWSQSPKKFNMGTGAQGPYLRITRQFDDAVQADNIELLAIEPATLDVRAKLRARRTEPACLVDLALDGMMGSLVAVRDNGEFRVGTFPLSSLAGPGPLPLAPIGLSFQQYASVPEQSWASNQVVAFDLQPAGKVVRLKVGTSTPTLSAPGGSLAYPLAIADDVYAVETNGSGDGWARIVRIDGDGARVVYRAAPQHRVSALAMDGTNIWWSECWGTANPLDSNQPNVEVWAAPYTRDPAILAATAQKVASIPSGRCIFNGQQLAQNGLFVAPSGPLNHVVRLSDKKVYSFENAPQRRTWVPLRVSQSEYWSIEAIPNGPLGVALTKLTLPAW